MESKANIAVTDEQMPIAPGHLKFPVVGLGASAGGLESLLRFFENMPADCGMAFVVILNLSPRHESRVDEIIQRVTRMPVMQVDASVAIEKNHVYVISPAVHLVMADGHLHVSAAERPCERQIAIDLFFRTLADAHQARAFAIVLLGTGADGAAGMARIKERGGLTIAEAPSDAEFDGMPHSAIEQGVADFVLPAVDMPQKLLDLWDNAQRIELPCVDKIADISHLPTSKEKAETAEAALARVLKLLAQRTGHDKRQSYSGAHQRALDLYGPPTILINPAFHILHLSQTGGRFLRHAGGDPSHNALSLVHPKLRAELRTAVLQALKTQRPTYTRAVPIRQDEKDICVKIGVQPFEDAEWDKQLVLLDFVETEPLAAEAQSRSSDELLNKALQTLDHEVQALTEQLQQTIEHSEELETSKKELQSMNEELITVNDELKTKVIETVKINDDLQNLISSNDIVTIFVDRNMRIKWFTPKSTTLFNLILADSGRSLMDITHRLEYPGLMTDVAQAFESLRLVEREVRSADGRSYLARILPYRTAEDRIDGAVLNFVDVTQLRRAQARLRESMERMRLLIDSTTEFAFITMDKAGRVTDWNRAAELMFGYEASQIVGRPIDIIFTPEDRTAGIPEQELNTAREQGRAADERWHIRRDGSRFYCSGVVHPMIDGELIGYAKIARDLTSVRLQQDEQQSHLQQTEASNVLKDEFIAIMSHELRHPLNLIQLNADLLSRSPGVLATKNAVKAVESIRRSVSSQAQIIADLLDLSRVKTGKLTLNRSLVNLADIVATAVEAMQPLACDSQIALRTEGFEQNTPLLIEGDATRIEQIVWNLLNNALKFTPSGGAVTVTLVCEDDRYARLDVQDTGIGIAPEFLDSIFDMFKQVSRQHNEGAKSGLGIGLALVEQLAKAHEGRVAATSEGEGCGSVFSLWLPLARHVANSAAIATAPLRHSLEGMRVLLVDDSEEILDVLSALCEMRSAIVMTATDGVKALALLQSSDVDVLVSDLGMPNMDGYTLLASLRKSKRNRDVPAIALTGYGQSEKARAVGFTDQLCKPVPMDELISKLSAIHQQKSRFDKS